MKKALFTLTLAVVSILFTACNQKELNQLREENAALQEQVGAKDAEIDSVFAALNAIEDNLAQVSAQYGAVQELRRDGEGNTNVRGKITEQISSIENLLADNKAKLANLNNRLGAQAKKNKELQEFVTKLETRIAEQEQQIAELNEELQNKNATIRVLNQNVAELTAANEEKDKTIAKRIAEANKAYYVVGTYKDLKSLGVIDKIGISKRRQQTTTSMETSVFTEIDRTQVATVTINAKRVKIVSKHPESSYQLVNDPNDSKVVSYLRILDQEQFWKYTDYLVISTR
ncbi:MAG: hypothetical protein II975_04875 [Bacteroidales bacterium]|nr:hypothetical protein [Bacteroidales bacterium]